MAVLSLAPALFDVQVPMVSQFHSIWTFAVSGNRDELDGNDDTHAC